MNDNFATALKIDATEAPVSRPRPSLRVIESKETFPVQEEFLTVSQKQMAAQLKELERVMALNPYSRDYEIQRQPFWPVGYDL